jgi:uncharacterized membrane protein
MWSEPFIAASFLFIVGVSLVLSRERAPDGRAWHRRLLWRAGGLYALAVALFVPHYGVALPDLSLSPGILSVIAVALALTGSTLATSRPATATGGLGVAVVAVTVALEGWALSVPGLNAGPGGAFPLVAFTAAGALVGLAHRAHGRHALTWASAIAALPFLVVVLVGAPWTTTHLSMHPSYGGDVALVDIFTAPTRRVAVPFWNHSVAGFLGLLLPLTLALRLLVAAESIVKRPPATVVCLIGRHALVAYVGHLIVLGVLSLVGLTPPGPLATWGLVLALALAAATAGATLEGGKRRHNRARAW